MTATDVQSQPLSELGRVSGVFFQPIQAFADIVARPRWFVPLILMIIASVTLVTVYSRHVGFERAVEKALEQSSQAQNMSAEQRAKAVEIGTKFAPISGYVAPIIFIPVSIMVVGLVLMLITNALFSAHVTFHQMSAVTAYAFLTNIVVSILAIVVMFIKDPDDFDLRNPIGFNIGAYLPDETPKWLLSLATSFDLFSFWTIALLATGIVVATNKPAWGKAILAVVAPWLLVVLIKAGWAGLFS